MSLMRFSGRLRPLALVLALVLPLAACGDDEPEGPGDPQLGDTIQGRLGDYKDFKLATLVTPAGRLGVGFAKPVNHLNKEDTTDLVARDAPDGGTFVPIVWSYDHQVFGPVSLLFGETKPLELRLIVDGDEYDVVPPSPGAKKSVEYVTVKGPAEKISLEATYDGHTQTMNQQGEVDKGVAAGLYDLVGKKVKARNCPIKRWLSNPQHFIQFTCKFSTAVASPYVYNTWAEPGHLWLSVRLVTNLQLFATGRLGESIANYSAVDVTDLSTLNGRKPLGTLENVESEGASSGVLIWDIQGRQLPKSMEMIRQYKLLLTGGTGKIDEPEKRTIKVGGRLDLVY